MKPRDLLRSATRKLPRARRGAAVLAYHLVDAGTSSVVDLSLHQFLTHLHLLERYDVVPLHEVDPEGSARQVVLTFDDAYANFHDVVWPLLKRFGFPATLYVPVDFIDGGAAPIRDTDARPCTWDQLQSMADEGLDIGSHTMSHADLGTVDTAQLDHELRSSKALLEDRLGVPVRSFCYPRGLRSPAAERIVEDVYETATVGGGRRYTASTRPSRIERTSLRKDHALQDLQAILDRPIILEEALADRVRQIRR